mmetsp:Transcript_57554/g.154592  ORF Transcript_57554/g.154592 Transcript_57554/m.154592 type:complete len:86 (+) Transcript_57554:287-544(+)
MPFPSFRAGPKRPFCAGVPCMRSTRKQFSWAITQNAQLSLQNTVTYKDANWLGCPLSLLMTGTGWGLLQRAPFGMARAIAEGARR